MTPTPTLEFARHLPTDAALVPSSDPDAVWITVSRTRSWVARYDPDTPGLDALPTVDAGKTLERSIASASDGRRRIRVTPARLPGCPFDLAGPTSDPLALWARHAADTDPWTYIQPTRLNQFLDRAPAPAQPGAEWPLLVAHQLGGPRAVIEFSTVDGPVWGYLMPAVFDPGYSYGLPSRFAPVAVPADREPQPGDGPDYHADHQAWTSRQTPHTEAAGR